MLTNVNEGSSLTIVNEELSLQVKLTAQRRAEKHTESLKLNIP